MKPPCLVFAELLIGRPITSAAVANMVYFCHARIELQPNESRKDAPRVGKRFRLHFAGDPTPSKADFAFTERLVALARIAEVRFLAHFVLGDAGFVSLRSLDASVFSCQQERGGAPIASRGAVRRRGDPNMEKPLKEAVA